MCVCVCVETTENLNVCISGIISPIALKFDMDDVKRSVPAIFGIILVEIDEGIEIL